MRIFQFWSIISKVDSKHVQEMKGMFEELLLQIKLNIEDEKFKTKFRLECL